MRDNIEKIREALKNRGRSVSNTPNGLRAQCPCHPDKKPSLFIRENADGRITCICKGCGAKGTDVIGELGLEMSILHDSKSEHITQTNPTDLCNKTHETSFKLTKQWSLSTKNLTPGRAKKLAEHIALPIECLDWADIGYDPVSKAYTIAETNEYDGIIGIQKRKIGNAKARDFRHTGQRGLVGVGYLSRTGRLIICEGVTDYLAMCHLGFYANVISRPSANDGIDLIKALLNAGDYTEVVVFGDNDDPGIRGADKLKDAIYRLIPTRVVFPKNHKDVREWVISGATQKEIEERIRQTRTNDRFMILTLDQLDQLPEPEFLVDNFIIKGSLAVLYGAPGSGKSFIALDIALSIQAGIPWHAAGRDIKQGQVIYVAGEAAAGQNSRAKSWKIGHHAYKTSCGKLGEARFLINPPMMDKFDDVAELIARLKRIPNVPDLIILDTLACTMTGDENSVKDMIAFVRGADQLRQEFGCTVLIIHHSGKSKDIRGSTALPGAVDTTIKVERKSKQNPIITITCEKQRDSQPFDKFAVTLTGSGGGIGSSAWLIPADPPENADKSGDRIKSEEANQVLNALSEAGSLGMKKMELLSLFPEQNKRTIERTIKDLKKNKDIFSKREGRKVRFFQIESNK